MVPAAFAVIAVLGFVLALAAGWFADLQRRRIVELEAAAAELDKAVTRGWHKGLALEKRFNDLVGEYGRVELLERKADNVLGLAQELKARLDERDKPAAPTIPAAGAIELDFLTDQHAKDIRAALGDPTVRRGVADGHWFNVRSVFAGRYVLTTRIDKA